MPEISSDKSAYTVGANNGQYRLRANSCGKLFSTYVWMSTTPVMILIRESCCGFFIHRIKISDGDPLSPQTIWKINFLDGHQG